MVSPVETTTEEETLPLVITRRAPREVTTSPIAIAADPVTEIVGINYFINFASVHALIIRQLVTEAHIEIIEVPEVEYEDAGRHASILPQLIQNSQSYTDTQRADILYYMQQIAWPSFQESVDQTRELVKSNYINLACENGWRSILSSWVRPGQMTMLPFFQFLKTRKDHSQWGRLVNTSQIPIPFNHASLYFLEEFKSQMAGRQYHQDSYENAMLLSIECIASWSHPGVVQTNLAYLDLSCLSIPKRLRKYVSNLSLMSCR